jgi:hypothetical protein
VAVAWLSHTAGVVPIGDTGELAAGAVAIGVVPTALDSGTGVTIAEVATEVYCAGDTGAELTGVDSEAEE